RTGRKRLCRPRGGGGAGGISPQCRPALQVPPIGRGAARVRHPGAGCPNRAASARGLSPPPTDPGAGDVLVARTGRCRHPPRSRGEFVILGYRVNLTSLTFCNAPHPYPGSCRPGSFIPWDEFRAFFREQVVFSFCPLEVAHRLPKRVCNNGG